MWYFTEEGCIETDSCYLQHRVAARLLHFAAYSALNALERGRSVINYKLILIRKLHIISPSLQRSPQAEGTSGDDLKVKMTRFSAFKPWLLFWQYSLNEPDVSFIVEIASKEKKHFFLNLDKEDYWKLSKKKNLELWHRWVLESGRAFQWTLTESSALGWISQVRSPF